MSREKALGKSETADETTVLDRPERTGVEAVTDRDLDVLETGLVVGGVLLAGFLGCLCAVVL